MKSRPVSPILVGVIVCLFACIFINLGGYGLYRDIKFEESTSRSTATIDFLWTSPGGKGGTNYHVRYHYTANGIDCRANDVAIGASTYYKLQVGQQVPIKFLAEDLTASRIDWPIEYQWHRRHDETGLVVGLFFVIIGLLVARFGKPSKTIPIGEAVEQ